MVDILIIEDNKELSQVICDFLVKENFTAIAFDNGYDGLNYLNNNTVKLVLLDLMLPNIDGFSVCKTIREKQNIPIIIISAKNGENDKILGLDLGADDFLEKPFSVNILLAKVKSHLRRSYELSPKNDIFSDGKLTIDKSAMKVYLKGVEVQMTTKEYELLLLLIENKGKTLNKQWIFNKVWGIDSFSELQALTVNINKLRDKLEQNPKDPKRIITVWGVGYRYETV